MDMIILSFSLKRTQAARQLRFWKESKFMINEFFLTMLNEEIASSILDKLPVSVEEVIELSFDSMFPYKSKKLNDDSSGSSNVALAQSNATIK